MELLAVSNPKQVEATETPRNDRGIGLSFSGGGFRATAYSLGSMALLQDLKLMECVRVLSGVSGGSVAVGAYLCSKAGSIAEKEDGLENQFEFYQDFYQPLLDYLDSDKLAKAFASLPRLAAGKKILHDAANDLNAFLEKRLAGRHGGENSARLCNEAIKKLLNSPGLSPDYTFFNAANISTLNLFRFGLQRSRAAEDDPIIVLNRYFIKNSGNATCQEIYRHARQIRLADCIASSFAFPVGFEPMIFPHDFFRDRSHHCNRDNSTASAARAAFELTPICDDKLYVPLLDGGLYDNLGLASIEDIRMLINKEAADQTGSQNQRIDYVIATDVDNIQPQNASYHDADLDAELQTRSGTEAAHKQRVRRLKRLIQPLLKWSLYVGLLVVAVALILFSPKGLPVINLTKSSLIITPPAALILVALILVALTPVLTRLLEQLFSLIVRLIQCPKKIIDTITKAPEPNPSLAQTLGFGTAFQDGNPAMDLGTTLMSLASRLLLSKQRGRHLATLKSTIIGRRFNQLLPILTGYMKRNRSLTYAYLTQTYAKADRNNCALIRNMIFELSPGPDVDPRQTMSEITTSAINYADLSDANANKPNWAVSRKLRRATNLAHWLTNEDIGNKPGEDAGENAANVWSLISDYKKTDFAANHPPRWPHGLEIRRAASIWLWLHQQLSLDPEQLPPGQTASNQTVKIPEQIRSLVHDVRQHLHSAANQASCNQPGLKQRLREHGEIALDNQTIESSWIPLICEMATNLPTTLWTSGFHFYICSAPASNGDQTPGQWYSYRPDSSVLQNRAWLDFETDSGIANRITILAGYISMAFNLLEFCYTSLSQKKQTGDTD